MVEFVGNWLIGFDSKNLYVFGFLCFGVYLMVLVLINFVDMV